jgi:oxygen-independent coproporphyrinogen-3 oxidase
MKLTFINSEKYRYESEATVRIFFPCEKIQIEIINDNSVDFQNIFQVVFENSGVEYKWQIETEIDENSAQIEKNIDTENAEYRLCKEIFLTLKNATGFTPPWGILTGVRPIKRILPYVDNKKTALEYMQNFNLVTPKKALLAYETAVNQVEILRNSDETFADLYVSIPFCPSRCSYCSFVSSSIDKAGFLLPRYVECLCREIELIASQIEQNRHIISTVYFGGGTPTMLSAEQFRTVMGVIAKKIDLKNCREYTVEAGRPDTITAEKLQVFKDFSVTRISINPQTFNDEVRFSLGRKHSSEEIFKAYELAKNFGFDVNMDLIAGLPGETSESFNNSLDTLIELAPENITVHSFASKKSADLFGQNVSASSANIINEEIDYSQKILTENGYSPYYLYRLKNMTGNLENVGYSKTGKACIYNIFMMDESRSVYGVGAGATTRIVRNGHFKRNVNFKYPYEYVNDFEKVLNKKS